MPAASLPLQPITSGAGPEYHRIFSTGLDVAELMAMKTMNQLKADPNLCSPQLLAKFEKIKGEPGKLEIGDEFDVRQILPNHGPVRVSHVDKHGFVLQTLAGHVGAGEIRFSLKQNGPDRFRFEIESLGRSRDKLVDLLYDKIPLAKIAESVLWIEFCENFATYASGLAGIELAGEPKVKVTTHRKAEATHHWETLEDD